MKKELFQSNLRWLIVILLTIVALSRGVWAAIGVFIFGLIILKLLKD